MKTYARQLIEDKVQGAIDAQAEPKTDNKRALMNYIAMSFYRAASDPETDLKSLLVLLAALSMISASEDSQALNNARRLAQSAFAGKRKKGK
jgi:hypothetical protein